MIPVFQTKFIHVDGTGDCFNACVASLLEKPLDEVSDINPHSPGVWFLNWKKWFKAQGLYLDICNKEMPPMGYTIVSCDTGRTYPEGHEKAGKPISHACISFDGKIVHDPFPGGLESSDYTIHFYYRITPLRDNDF